MRAAIYARYSSDMQSEASIEDQVRLCRERAGSEGFRIAEVFSDSAISGGFLKNRPGMLSLLEHARSGEFELVVAEALDRISRDQEDIAAIFKRLNHAGVRIITLAEGEISELHIGLKGTMNALFLKDLAQKTRRGQRGRVEAGKIPGGNSYGYEMVRTMQDDGSVTTGERIIHAAEAAIVRRIFREYADGLAPRKMASRLNEEGIPSPRGGLWNASTINGSRQRRNGILNNELYRGRIIYNRQAFLKDPETGKRLSRPNPESEWVTTEVPHLRIIDEERWESVQVIKERYSSLRGNRRQTKKRLLSGLVRCGACGSNMTIINRERYSCSAKRERGTCSSPVGIKAAELEKRVLDGLREILHGRQDLVEEFATAYQEEVERLRCSRTNDGLRLQKELAKVQRGIDRCLAYITDGDGDPGTVRESLKELENRKRALERQLREAGSLSTVVLHPNIADHYRRKVKELQILFTDDASRQQAMEIVRSLIDHIEGCRGEKRGMPDVILVGTLANILEYACEETKKAASAEGGVGRVLLVAGVGFEPTTFRL
ncbi:recombinase family protein [Silicimonas sp. MF1-12-2]|uniref:recombinase family protein n=1 Tax=Silicimonas sp. MF1-12-2 TaxID=3384793 RepID=UPI0039B5884B